MVQSLEKKVSNYLSLILKENNIEDDVFAVGVSGGADSLAMIYLLKYWAKENNKKLVALTVNHGLRSESLEEAEYVAGLMKKEKIEHHILTWHGDKPKTGIEEAARLARYGLIEEYCVKHNIKYLMIAHHKQDQAETFLMRLQRGSGVDGLSAMTEVSSLGKIKLVRPLLDIGPEELKSFLTSKNIKWCEDASNYDEDFLRVKIRNLLPYLDDKIGLSLDRIASTAKVLGRTKDYIEKQVNNFIKNNIKFYNNKVAKVSLVLLQKQHEEMIFRIISQLIKNIADRAYIPRAGDVQRVVDSIIQDGKNFRSRTLGGCELISSSGSLWIIPEAKDAKILTKQEWNDFVEKKPQYEKIKLPYKVRKIIKSIEF